MGTLTTKSEVYQDIEQALGTVPDWVKQLPEAALPGFWSVMRDFQLAETRIPNKYKELIGLAVSGATRCRYCALFHTEAARLFGASDEELAEASMMGAHTMFASTFLNAQQVNYDTFRDETLAIVAHVKQQLATSGGKGQEAQPSAGQAVHA
jgi:AhpD family alkylhydroperoxidase